MHVRFGVLTSLLLAASATAQVPEEQAVKSFVQAFLPHASNSVVDLQVNHRATGPTGQYLAITAVRTKGAGKDDADQIGLLLDPVARTVTVGMITPLPRLDRPMTEASLPAFAEQLLPQALSQMMGSRVQVRWPASPARPTGVIPLQARLSTGFGFSGIPIAISGDAAWFAMGATWPLDRDPRAVRRERLSGAPVLWDPGHDKAVLQVVEFSDFQCPACKRAWGEVGPVFAGFGDKLRHGLANFPLVMSHPWAFRASVAAVCVGERWPDKVIALKEEMYNQQSSLSAETIDEAVIAFVQQQGLDEQAFRACYMKDPAVDLVLNQLAIGHSVGVTGTPAYFVNGELMPFAKPEIIQARIKQILDAGGLPEKADAAPAPKATSK